MHELLGEASDTTELIFTGIKLCPEMMDWADDVYQITALGRNLKGLLTKHLEDAILKKIEQKR